MRNIRKVRTADGKTVLSWIDGSLINYSFTTARLILNELIALSQHETALFHALSSQDADAIRDAHMLVSVKGQGPDGQLDYRFRLIRLLYRREGNKYFYIVNLPTGLPISLQEAAELREILRRHAKFNGIGAIVTPPELESVDENQDSKTEATDEEELCPHYRGDGSRKDGEELCYSCMLNRDDYAGCPFAPDDDDDADDETDSDDNDEEAEN